MFKKLFLQSIWAAGAVSALTGLILFTIFFLGFLDSMNALFVSAMGTTAMVNEAALATHLVLALMAFAFMGLGALMVAYAENPRFF